MGGTTFLGHTQKYKIFGRALSGAGWVRSGCSAHRWIRNDELYNLVYGFGGLAGHLGGVKTRKTCQFHQILTKLGVGKSESCQKNPKFHAEFDGAIRLAPFWVFPR